MMNELIMRDYNAVTIYQRRADRYLDATAMCKANGKRWPDYWRMKNTQKFVTELSSIVGIHTIDLVQSQVGREGGTFIHPRIAIHLAQWLSARFAVAVSDWIEELLTTGTVSLAPVTGAKWLLQQAQLMVQAEEQLARQQEQVNEVQQKVERLEDRQQLTDVNSASAQKMAVAAVDIHSSNYGFYTVLGWSKIKSRSCDVKLASQHGRKLSKICRAAGRTTGSVKDARFGEVNTYPEDVLERYFSEVEDM
jgi:hypothetical protein